jgi:Tol biopolymer transport system component
MATRRIGFWLIILIASCVSCLLGSYTLINVTGFGRVRCPSGVRYDDPTWSPDSGQIAFESYGVICVVQADGSKVEGLTAGFAPSWSPDGQQIVFSSRTYWTIYGPDTSDLYVMNRDGSHIVRLTPTGSSAVEPAWSPDGKRIAFASYDKAGIWLYHLDGSTETQLTNVSGAQQPKWSPDGRRIAFSVLGTASGFGGIAVIDADGQNYKQLFDQDYGIDLNRHPPTWSRMAAE